MPIEHIIGKNPKLQAMYKISFGKDITPVLDFLILDENDIEILGDLAISYNDKLLRLTNWFFACEASSRYTGYSSYKIGDICAGLFFLDFSLLEGKIEILNILISDLKDIYLHYHNKTCFPSNYIPNKYPN